MDVAGGENQIRSANEADSSSAKVQSATAHLAREIEKAIAREGKALSDFGALSIVVDRPSGFALKCLADAPPENAVIFTNNPCPEYWEDLWDLKPQALLVGGHDSGELVSALTRASKGEHFRQTPRHETSVLPMRPSPFSHPRAIA